MKVPGALSRIRDGEPAQCFGHEGCRCGADGAPSPVEAYALQASVIAHDDFQLDRVSARGILVDHGLRDVVELRGFRAANGNGP